MRQPGQPRQQRPVVEALDAKLLYSADMGVAAFMPDNGTALQQTVPTAEATMAVLDADVALLAQARGLELAFIDATVTDVRGLVADLQRQADAGRAIEVILIRADEDGITRITQTLQERHDVSAIHLIGHGVPGGMQLGSTELDADSLMRRVEDIAQWGTALSTDGDMLLYGCDVGLGTPGRNLVESLRALTGADVAASNDPTGASVLGGDWELEVQAGQIDSTVAFSAAMQAQWQALLIEATPSTKGTAIWSQSGDAAPQQNGWDGLTLGEQTNTATLSTLRVITSAQSPTRNEAIVVGVDASGAVRGQRWDGTQWTALPTNPLASGTVADRQGFAVAYEQSSGDAVLVWNNGTTLRYSVFNGTTWTTAAAISAYTGTAPHQMRMVAQPRGDGMVLVVSDASGDDRALVWNGSSWGNAVTLDASGTGSADQLSTTVAYEGLSGHAMVAYAKAGNANVYYRMFNGSSWGSEVAVGAFAESAVPLWVTLASDPSSDRIGLGVLSTGAADASQVSLAVWDGSSWGTRLVADSTTDATPGPSVALAFESRSGDLLAVYGSSDTAVRYRTWTSAGGWSAQATGPNTGTPGVMRLFADPNTNHIMMGVQAEGGAVSFTDWNGSAFGTTNTVTTASGSSLTPAFTWVWNEANLGNLTNTLIVGGNNDTSGWRGINNVSDTEVMTFGNPGLSYGAGSTYGSFSHMVDLAAMGAQGVDDIVMVARDLTIATGIAVQRGDLLFTTSSASTLVNADGSTLAVNEDDVVRFRPSVSGQYGQGTFSILVQSLGSTRIGASLITIRGPNVRGLALVEQSTTVAGTTLAPGTLLFTSGTGTAAANIQYLTLGSGSLLGGVLVGANASTLITGSNVNINQAITGLEVISASTPLANVTLNAGSLLFTLEQADNNVGNLGAPISMNQGDVAILTPANASQATATLLLQGNQVGITGQAFDSLALSLNAAPVVSSNGGGATATISVNENTTAVTTVAATDVDGDTLSYNITGGADARRFQINASTGVLTFGSAMNFEDPISAVNSNAYQVIVSASDGTSTDTQTITVNVVNVNETPTIEAPPGMSSIFGYNFMDIPTGNVNVFTIKASDPDGQALTYSLEGLSANSFTVNASSGVVKLKSAMNADGDDYLLTLVATDPNGARATLSIVLQASDSVSAGNDYAPSISGGTSQTFSVSEQQTYVTTISAADSDYDAAITYSITSGYGDASLFQINAVTGELRFKDAPIYVSGGDNSYAVGVTASDGTYSDTQTLTVNVIDHNDAPVNTLPSVFSTGEDTAVSLTGISVADADAASGTVTVTFSVQHGTLTVLSSVSGGVNSGQISYASGNRQVTLSGTVSAINATLAATNGLRYQADSNYAGTDTLTMLANDQGNSGQAYTPATTTDTDTARIVVAAVADATVAAASASALSYTENAAATPIDAALTLNDVDGASITGATVRITGNYVNGQDVLSFVNQAGITGTWDASTGTMTLSGTGGISAWQTALRAVSYLNTSDAPNTTARTVTFNVTDAGSTVSATRGIAITAVNDLPVLTGTGTALTYTENGAATAIDPGVTISDVDSTTFTSATVSVTGNHASTEDVLSFTNQLGITGSWNAATGILTLSGSASAANYQTALRSVAYRNSSDNPSTAARTITFSVIESNGSGSSTRNVTIAAVNDAPTLTATPSAQTHALGDAPTVVDATLNLIDPDTATLSGATIRITSGYDSNDDVLSFTSQAGITGSWNNFNGTLTLSGTASVSDYQSALRSVTFVDTGLITFTGDRTITFSVNDGSGAVTAARVMQVTNNNAAPNLNTSGSTLAYTEGNTTAIDTGLTLSDSDTSTLSLATIRITGNYVSGQDELAFADQLGLTGSWDAATGTLTLSGGASVSDFQAALRSVTYRNTSDNPTTTSRTVTFTVVDGGNSVSDTRGIAISPINDAPVIGASSGVLNYTENDGATAIDPGLSFDDPDTPAITSATVQITGNYASGQDVLSFVDQAGITGSWTAGTGTLTLSGNASPADYQAALRSVAYSNSSNAPDTSLRTVTFTVDEGGLGVSTTRDIAIATNDDATAITLTSPTFNFTEGDPATSIDAGLMLDDVDSTNLIGATVEISSNYRDDQDALIFTDQAGITGTWDVAGGTLQLTGTASVADYQAALRSITYGNTAQDPDTLTRTLTITVDDGSSTSTAQRDIAVYTANDVPTLTTSSGTAIYTEDAPATNVDPDLILSDLDNTGLNGALVQITGHFVNGEDELTFTNQLGITGSWSNSTGMLTLTGNASTADYETALRGVGYYNRSGTPDTANRTITFTINDGSGDVTAQRDVAVIALSDPPVITTTAAPLSYTENDTAIAVDPGLTVTDIDAGSFIGATVQITGNYDATQDVLSFTAQSGVTSSWAADTGTLTLMGNASMATYEAALRSVMYHNTSDDPAIATRTVTFSFSDGVTTASASRDIAITSVLDAPLLSPSVATLPYTENDGPTTIDPALSLGDADSLTITDGMVSISAQYAAGQDELRFTDQAGITGTWNGLTGILTLQGAASVADYEAALRSIQYVNSSDAPETGTRTVTFQVSDGINTGTTTVDIVFTAVDDAPEMSANGSPLSYTENDPATPVDAMLSITDVDGGVLNGAEVQITGHFVTGQDMLAFTDQLGITGSWNASTGTLTLSGAASASDYQAALRSVGYRNTSDDPDTTQRTVTWRLMHNSATVQATRDITLTAVSDAPTFTNNGAALVYTENAPATAIATTLVLTDADTATLSSATAQITGQYTAGQDILSFVNQGGITGTWDAATGTLTLNGSASIASYEAALRNIAYANTADDPLTTTRTVTFVVDDGTGPQSVTHDISIQAITDGPQVLSNNLTVVQGGQAMLVMVIEDVDTPAGSLTINVDSVSGGHFTNTQTSAVATTFSYSDVQAGLILFTQDGSLTTPSYTLSVSDGQSTAASTTGAVTFLPIPISAPIAPPDTAPDVVSEEPDPTTSSEEADTPAVEEVFSDTLLSQAEQALAVAAPGAGLDALRILALERDRADGPSPNRFFIDYQASDTTKPQATSAPALVVDTFRINLAGDMQALINPEELRRNLDALQEQFQETGAERRNVVASSIALTTGLSVGYVIWLVRGGALLGSMLSAMPAWQMIDPLPVLTRSRGGSSLPIDADDDQPIEHLFDEHHSAPDDPVEDMTSTPTLPPDASSPITPPEVRS